MNNISNIMPRRGKYLLAGAFLATALTVSAAGGRELQGRVVDPQGEPIPGAVVNIAEQSRIVLTDADGRFVLKNVGFEDEVNTKCIGYVTSIQPVDDFEKEFVVVLVPDNDYYSALQNLAFHNKEKKYTTEATTSVKGTELQRFPITLLQNAFNSTLTGIQVYEGSSEPGWSESKMYIRGVRTMNKSANSPIVIVDNVERDLSFLDAFPIDNITILKDAAATALYGMRGANGVILVTTKRGEAGKTHIDFTQEFGFNTLTGKVENQNSYNFAITRNQALYLDGKDPMYSAEQIEKYRRVCNGETLEGMDQYRYFNTNWFEQLYRETAPVWKTNLQISGGSKRTRYYVSFSYLRQEGMWNSEGTNFNDNFTTQHVLNRWNLRSNLDIQVTDFLRVSMDLGGRIDNILQPTTGVYSLTTFGAVEANPMEPVYTPRGDLYFSGTANNPIALLGASGQEKNRRRQLYSTVTVNGDLSKLTKGLGVEGVVSFDAYDGFQSSQYNNINAYSYDYTNTAVNSIDEFTYTQTRTYSELTNPTANERDNSWTLNMRGGLTYDRDFGFVKVDANAFVRSYMKRLNVGPHSADQAYLSSDRYLSYNGLLNLVFLNRYILNGSISYMGNDNFDPSNRWDTFYGVGAGWLINNEPWLRKPWLELLKLRASYGKAGMSDIGAGRYPYQSTYSQNGGYSFGYNATWVGGYSEKIAGNANAKWEISKMVNVGLDWSLFNRKFYGNFDAFKEWRSDILIERSTIPSMLGISFAKDSYGKVESWGYELTVGHTNTVGKVTYSIEGMLSYNKNKITEMDEVEPAVEWQRKTGGRIRDYASVGNLYEASEPIPTWFGGWNILHFEQWASDPNLIATSQQDAIDHPEKYPYNTYASGKQRLGTAVFRDVNGDRIIDSRDMEPTKYTVLPDLTPSFSLSVQYAGFDLRAILTAYLHRQVFLSPSITYSPWGNHATHEVTKAWGYYTDDPLDPRNINATYPRLSTTYNPEDSNRDSGSYLSDIWIINGDYLSLRNIEFGYSLPAKLIAKAHMTKCRFYFSGYNLMTWSHVPKGMDPEKPISFCWWYPKTRTFTFGVNVAF